MTLIAFLLSVLIGCVSLAYGYSQAGMSEFARGFVLLGAAWVWTSLAKAVLGVFRRVLSYAVRRGIWRVE
ncbi:MAG: hypothetical protein HS124_08120 [Anaerolineales bacterium]|nr:hypothetical protein [Anaerolineales bacterium]